MMSKFNIRYNAEALPSMDGKYEKETCISDTKKFLLSFLQTHGFLYHWQKYCEYTIMLKIHKPCETNDSIMDVLLICISTALKNFKSLFIHKIVFNIHKKCKIGFLN